MTVGENHHPILLYWDPDGAPTRAVDPDGAPARAVGGKCKYLRFTARWPNLRGLGAEPQQAAPNRPHPVQPVGGHPLSPPRPLGRPRAAGQNMTF